MSEADTASAADDGAGHHEGGEATDDRVEIGDAWHLIVLVGTVGSALAVGVVLDENDRFFALLLETRHDTLRDHLAGAVHRSASRAPSVSGAEYSG